MKKEKKKEKRRERERGREREGGLKGFKWFPL